MGNMSRGNGVPLLDMRGIDEKLQDGRGRSRALRRQRPPAGFRSMPLW